MSLNVESIRADFPALQDKKARYIYMDNACVTLRPQAVIDAMNAYYTSHPSCHRRSVHKFGRQTTSKYEEAKRSVRDFIRAEDADEIIFTRNATESINLVANEFPFSDGDSILTSDLEHNSNYIPWLVAAKTRGLKHKIFSLSDDLSFDRDKFVKQLQTGVKLVSVVHTSHVTGVTLPLKEIIELSHDHGAFVLVDAAQSVAHKPIDVQALDVDFLAFSFHKMLGPSGMGCLYAKKKHLQAMHPFVVGGETVDDVSYNSFVLTKIPERFEAGLQNYAGACGVTAAIDYLRQVKLENIQAHVADLNQYITDAIGGLDKIRLIGPADSAARSGIINFAVEGMDAGELSILLDQTSNIMVRSGVHCCHAGYKRYRLPESVRVSLYLYNTRDEADTLIQTIKQIVEHF